MGTRKNRWLLAVITATIFALWSPRSARAQLLPAADVYREVSELIEELIRAEVGKSVATVIDNGMSGRYFKVTAARLRSQYWGALDATVEADLIELLVDYAYFTAQHGDATGKRFWECVRGSAKEKECGFEKEKTLFESHCPPTAVSVACDFAQTLHATLERKDESARSASVQLLGDLLLVAHLKNPTPAQFVAFRERLRAWIADPDRARQQIDQLASEYGIPKLQLQQAIDCAKEPTKSTIFERTSILSCFKKAEWVKKWQELTVVRVMVDAADKTEQSWTVKALTGPQVLNVTALVDAQINHICAGEGDSKTKAAELREATESAQRAVRKGQLAVLSAEMGVTSLTSLLKTRTAEHAQALREGQAATAEQLEKVVRTTNAELTDAKKKLEAAKLEGDSAQKKLAQANNAEAELQKKMKGYFESHGVECSTLKPKFLPGVGVTLKMGDLELKVDQQTLERVASQVSAPLGDDPLYARLRRMNEGLAFAATTPEAIQGFERRVAALICEGCSLEGSVALLGRLRTASDFFMSMDVAGRERLFSDLGSVAELAGALGAKHEHAHLAEVLSPVLHAAQRRDYRQLVSEALEQLWPTPSSEAAADNDQVHRTFFKTFAGFLLDSQRGTDSGKGTAVAFREAAKDVLVRANKRGLPNEQSLSGFPISVSLRQSWNRTYDDGRRTLASVDVLSARFAVIKYAGFGGSAFDVLEPFQEFALRDQNVEYGKDGLVALNLFHPRIFAWLAVPEFSRFLALDAAVAYRPVSPLKDEEQCEEDCDRTYSLKGEALDHLEMSLAATLLF